jgi:hypothetical protein
MAEHQLIDLSHLLILIHPPDPQVKLGEIILENRLVFATIPLIPKLSWVRSFLKID